MKQPSIEQQVGFLRQVPIFAGLDDKMLSLLAGLMSLTRETSGKVLCEQGAPGDGCFIVGHGQVQVVLNVAGEERVLTGLGPGHVVGEVSLIDGKRRSASVRCKTDASIFTLRRDDFEQLYRSGNPAGQKLLHNIARDVAQRVRIANERFTDIFSNPVETISSLSEQINELLASTEFDGAEFDDGNEPDLLAIMGYQSGIPSSK